MHFYKHYFKTIVEVIKMYGKKKKKGGFPKNTKQKKPMYDSLLHLWETSIDNDVNDILGSYTGRPKDGGVPDQDEDDL